ncbi:hypothetical protein [Priestia aryabhattai]|uniref:hypothetical protein n=1 Tax=Priestia aryabhattai TaxID=412384 RepID=UPI001ADD459F|nr:hypothetical protein [Priestia aryabhattai]QTL49974.1 hypothetical protein J5Z55_02330 [Priestia aryabhattai]
MTLTELLMDKYKLNEGHLKLLDSVLNHFHKYGGEHEAYNLDDLKGFTFNLEVLENVDFSDSIDLMQLAKNADKKYSFHYDLAVHLCQVGILQHTKTRQQEWFVLNELLRDASFYKELSILRVRLTLDNLKI